jgi:hypothetical protein
MLENKAQNPLDASFLKECCQKIYIKIPKIFSISLLKAVSWVQEFLPALGSINNRYLLIY